MKSIFFVIALISIIISNPLSGQDFTKKKSIQLGVNYGVTPGINVVQDYDFLNDEFTGLYGDNHWDFEGYVKYQNDLSKHFTWHAGLHVGFLSLKYNLYIDNTFNELNQGEEGFGDYFVEYGSILYGGLSTGLSYNYHFNANHKAYIYLGGQIIYFSPLSSAGVGITINEEDVFDMDYKVNPNNDLLFAPELGLHYQYSFKNKPFFLSIGTNVIFQLSQKSHLDGTYTIIGETEDKVGSFSKKYIKAGMEVGFGYYL